MEKTQEQGGGLIDLSGVPLADIWGLDPDTVLAHSIRRVMPVQEDLDQSVSAFNSAV